MQHHIYLAYDGSINADWVARYAVRLADVTANRRLTLLHIDDGALTEDRREKKIAAIISAGRLLEVDIVVLRLPLGESVYTTLLASIPAGGEHYCICGARATSRGKGFLAGTVSQRLLRSKRFNTLAIRVVNPGLLGCPENVLFPLAGHPRMFKAAMPFLLMLVPCVRRLILLRVMTVHPLFSRYLPMAVARGKLRGGVDYVGKVLKEIESVAQGHRFSLDERVVISDDWAKEILIQAGKVKAGMILLGASDRFFQSRFFYGNKIEQILRNAPCDIGVYRKI